MVKRNGIAIKILLFLVSLILMISVFSVFTYYQNNAKNKLLLKDGNNIVAKNNVSLGNDSSSIRRPGTNEFNENGPVELNNENTILIYSGDIPFNNKFTNRSEYLPNLGANFYNAFSVQMTSGVNGTLENPWKVETAEQFIAMLRDTASNNNYVLKNHFVINLDSSGARNWMENVVQNGRGDKVEFIDSNEDGARKHLKVKLMEKAIQFGLVNLINQIGN